MTDEERTTRLRQMGYTDREASFLLLAALHSGTFVMRQYASFCDVKNGALTDQFVRKAGVQRHIKPFPTRNRTLVYQVCKPVFVAIGDQDNRNRRMKQVDLTRLRLMGLDFVLRNLQYHFHATEAEKVEYFSALTGGTVSFPSRVYTSNLTRKQTTRFFVEKYPIFEKSSGAGLTFIDEDSVLAFEVFLERYMPLLSAIPAAEIVFVTTNAAMVPQAQTVFNLKTRGRDSRIDFTTVELEFRERTALEARPISELEMDDLRKLRGLQRSRLSPFFDTWKAGGVAAIQEKIGPLDMRSGPRATHFTPYVLPDGYAFL